MGLTTHLHKEWLELCLHSPYMPLRHVQGQLYFFLQMYTMLLLHFKKETDTRLSKCTHYRYDKKTMLHTWKTSLEAQRIRRCAGYSVPPTTRQISLISRSAYKVAILCSTVDELSTYKQEQQVVIQYIRLTGSFSPFIYKTYVPRYLQLNLMLQQYLPLSIHYFPSSLE